VLTDERLRPHRSQTDSSRSSDKSASPDVLTAGPGNSTVRGPGPIGTDQALADGYRPPCRGQSGPRPMTGTDVMVDLLGSITIPGRPEHVRLARQFTAVFLHEKGAIVDTAVLLVSELVSNSILHSDSHLPSGMITVTLFGVPGGIRADVTDQGSASIPTLTTGAESAEPTENGRGLLLVHQLSDRWGVVPAPGCTVTWFELMGQSR
jgi:anti-sigma regulatory factor (Ser/Thr protein kinase)